MRKFFSGIVFFLFCIFVVPLLFVFAFSRTYFSEDFYRGPFIDQIQTLFHEVLVNQIVVSGESFNIVFLKEDIRPIVSESFDRNFFGKVISRLVDQFSALSPQNPFIQIDFHDLRDPLRQFFSRIAKLVLASHPQFRPDPAFEQNLFHQFESQTGFLNGKISLSFQDNIEQIQLLKKIVFYLPYITFGILFFLAFMTFLISGKPYSGAFSFLSKMFFTSSILVAASGFLFLAIPKYLKAEYFPSDVASYFETFRASLQFLLSPFSSEFFLYAGILTGLSVLFYFLARSKMET